MELIPGKVYYIYQPCTPYLTHDFYKGTFVNKIKVMYHFENITALKPYQELGSGCFGERELYYEVDKVKENAAKARQTMEKRALDMILKRILNEDFSWF